MNITKYKAKRLNNNEWVDGYIFEHEPPLHCFSNENTEKSKWYIARTAFADWDMPREVEFIEVDKNTICQYIKHEKFYENDVLFGEEKDSFGCVMSSWYGLVKYDKDTERIRIIDDLGNWYETDEFIEDKVIGNIIDNPEFLEMFKE